MPTKAIPVTDATTETLSEVVNLTDNLSELLACNFSLRFDFNGSVRLDPGVLSLEICILTFSVLCFRFSSLPLIDAKTKNYHHSCPLSLAVQLVLAELGVRIWVVVWGYRNVEMWRSAAESSTFEDQLQKPVEAIIYAGFGTKLCWKIVSTS